MTITAPINASVERNSSGLNEVMADNFSARCSYSLSSCRHLRLRKVRPGGAILTLACRPRILFWWFWGRECGHGRLPSLVCCCVPAGRGSRGSFDALRIHAVAACFWIRTGRIVRAESDLWPEIWGVAPGAGLNDTIDGDTVSSSGATPVGRFWKVSGRHSGHKVRCTGTRCGRRQWAGFVVRQFGAPLL